jgi:hypothetical protein
MNIRCAFCQTPYTLSRNEILFALQKIESEKLNHYDAHCPRCRRATQLPTQRLEMAFPNWRQAVQEAASASVAEVPEPQSVKSTETVATEPIKKEEPATIKIQPVKPAEIFVKKPAGKEKAAPTKTKPAMLKKTAPKKTAAKAKPVAKKPDKSRRK